MADATTGVPSSFRAPLTAIELLFGQGASNAPAGPRSAIYVCKMLASGATAVANTRYEITSDKQAETLFGKGSEGHRVALMHIAKNPSGRFAVVPYLPSSGSGLASADLDVVFTGTATGNGTAVFDVCGEDVVVGITSGDTPTAIGAELEAKILGITKLPVTAVDTAGTVAVSAKHAGASQNAVHRVTLVKIDASTGVTCTVAGSTTGLLADGIDGSVTETANLTSALTSINAVSDYYVTTPSVVAAHIALVKTHVVNKNAPIVGIRCCGFFPFTGSLSSLVTIANAQNTHLMEAAWLRNASQSPDEIVAWYTASKQKEESANPRFNFKGYSANGFLKPVADSASWPTLTDINDAMNEGFASLVSTATGVYLSAGVTTSSKDSTGAIDDYRANLSHRRSIMHHVGDTIGVNHRLEFSNFIQVDDPLLPDGAINLAAINEFDPQTTCPFLFKKWFLAQMSDFFPALLQDEPAWQASTNVRIDPDNNSRMQVTAAGRTVDVHLQATVRLSETTSN